jgi:hypothetical protein
MYVDDMARSVALIIDLNMSQFYEEETFWNIGIGVELS